jgi:hypothetical protein
MCSSTGEKGKLTKPAVALQSSLFLTLKSSGIETQSRINILNSSANAINS